MGLEGGPRLMKIALIVVNTLVLAAGGVTIGIGVWSLVSDYGARDLASITGSSLYEAACIVIIVGGCVVAALSLIGCCGAVSECRWLLAIYFSALILLLVVFIAGAVLGFVYKNDLEEELEKEMTKTLKERYEVDLNQNDKNQEVTDVWNKIQNKLKCCGVSGGLTSNTAWYMWQESEWFKAQIQFQKSLVPSSCCDSDNFTFDKCQHINSDDTQPPQTNLTRISNENPALFSDGCIDKVKDEIEDHVVAIAIVAVVVLVVMLLCILFSLCVFKQIGKQSMVV
ncbi:tetraspanin [Elysia marginata]|uniref:Tetraspanin n=1 Tax=Elysia marginata TaxID=1093978 RepID=A0AAV4J777_9GAST|nr:tetraspanin [Elysia marginata]